MDTTVLIPAKVSSVRELNMLKGAIRSVPRDVGVVVGFNNSAINVGSVARDFPSIETHTFEAKNLAQARNKLVKWVNSKYFLFLDLDDQLGEGAIERMEAAHPGNGYVYGETLLFTADSQLTYPAKDFDCGRLAKEVYFPSGVLHLASNIGKVKWDEKLDILEDKEFWIAAAEQGICGHPLKYLTYKYRQGEGMVARGKGTPEWNKAEAYILEKHQAFFRGEYPDMACCGKGKTQTIQGGGSQAQAAILSISAGQIQLRYMLGTGPVTYYGAISGKPYKVSAQKPYVAVDAKDARTGNAKKPGLLELMKNKKAVFTSA